MIYGFNVTSEGDQTKMSGLWGQLQVSEELPGPGVLPVPLPSREESQPGGGRRQTDTTLAKLIFLDGANRRDPVDGSIEEAQIMEWAILVP